MSRLATASLTLKQQITILQLFVVRTRSFNYRYSSIYTLELSNCSIQ